MQPTKRETEAKPSQPPANNPQQARPNPQAPPAHTGNTTPNAKQEFGPQQGNKNTSTDAPNKGGKKDKQNKDEKKKDN